ncbi:MAG: hypothetical protein LUC22_01805, partial [Prevotella sp.]|nr:hypothetical protein [Prevotella sp.]
MNKLILLSLFLTCGLAIHSEKVRANESTSSLDAECSRSSTVVKVRANESTSSLDAECSRS